MDTDNVEEIVAQRNRLRALLIDLIKYGDDHNWGMMPEGEIIDRARAEDGKDRMELIEQIARKLKPEWFRMMEDGRCGLDNYPNQHLKFQEMARQRAREIIDMVLSNRMS